MWVTWKQNKWTWAHEKVTKLWSIRKLSKGHRQMVNQCQQSSRLWIWQICSFCDVLSWGDNFYPGGISSPGTCNAETDKTDAATRISLGSSSWLSRTKHNHTGSTFKVIDFLDLRVQFVQVESRRDIKSLTLDLVDVSCVLTLRQVELFLQISLRKSTRPCIATDTDASWIDEIESLGKLDSSHNSNGALMMLRK